MFYIFYSNSATKKSISRTVVLKIDFFWLEKMSPQRGRDEKCVNPDDNFFMVSVGAKDCFKTLPGTFSLI